MRARAQLRWAIVDRNGHINHGTMAMTRAWVIKEFVAEWRRYPWFVAKHPNLTRALFWRAIKRRGYSVRRISLRVVS